MHDSDDAGTEGDEPQRHLGYLIRRVQQRHVATWALLASTEISSVQYAILAVLARRGEASQRELCDDVDLDRSTVADLVTRMQRRGLIERRRSKEDARRNVVSLTTGGRDEFDRLRPRVESVQRELGARLSAEDVGHLRDLLQAMLSHPA